MRWAHASALTGLAVTMTAIAACQLVSGIANLDIVDDAGSSSDATMEASGQHDATGDAQNDATSDSTFEAAPDVTADTAGEAASDSPSTGEAGVDATGDADGGLDSTVDSSDASDGSDAGNASDASDAGDASDGPVEAGCSFGWQCPTGFCASGGLCLEPPSCQGQPKTCGPGGNEDCCASLTIPAGGGGVTYHRSFDGMLYMDQSNPATLAGPFALDKFEVTVERFEKFIVAYTGAPPPTGSGNYPPVAGTGWDPSWVIPSSKAALVTAVTTSSASCMQPFAPPSGQQPTTPHLPMNCVDWNLAFAFCAWDGSRLPTEAEWNFAAGGGAAQRVYPWLMGPPQIDSTFAWYNCQGMGTMEPDGGPGTCNNAGAPFPVGLLTKGSALYGHTDMAGSMLEPTMDYYGSYPNPCTNCVNTNAASGQRVYRGGSYIDTPMSLDDGYRNSVGPTYSAANLGIRCAR